MPDDRYEGLGKLVTIFGVTLLVSGGLCGATAALSSAGSSGGWILPFGLLELLGMIVGAFGLFAVGVTAFIKYIASFGDKDPQ